ncbi:MAG: hypothetical protein L6M37_03245 [Candidatus Methylarchaceae archaeon HK02M1]|nr:hypothetical protein [Candidatus Methylarchaceae archaeon HK02M1]
MKKYTIIMIVMLFLILPFIPCKADAQITIDKVSYFNHQMTLNDYGFILVDDTIVVQNDFEEDAALPPINITYPLEFYDLIATHSVSPTDFGYSKVLTENYTVLTLTPPQDYKIPPNGNAIISLKMYFVRTLSSSGELNYTASMPLVPALSLPIEKLDSSLIIPISTFFPPVQYKNFTAKRIDNRWALIGNFSNLNQGFSITENVIIMAEENLYFALLEFTEAKRELAISPLGNIIVSDMITIINYGDIEISKIKPSLLTDDFGSITVFPTLSNTFPNPKSDADKNQVDIGTSLKKGERYTVRLEYPITSSDFINVKESLFELLVPLRPSIDGVINEYTVRVIYPEGFLVYDKTKEFKVNANPLDDSELRIAFRHGLAWASIDIIPVASFIFIITLIASLIVGRPMVKKEGGVIEKIEDYAESFDGKITANKELIDTYKKRQSGQISKSDFNKMRQSIEGRRNKASTNINILKSELVDEQPSLQKPLSNIGELNQKYDQVVKDLMELYEQLYTKKIKGRVFDRLLPSDQKRLYKIERRILDSIDLLRSEAE